MNQPQDVDSLPTEEGDALGFALVGHYLGFVLRAPARHRALAVAVLATIGIFTAFLLYALPQRYQVRTALLAQRTPLMGALSNPTMNREWDAPARSARDVVIRRDNLLALCRQTRFAERYVEKRPAALRARDWVYRAVTGKERNEEEILEGLIQTLEERLWVEVGQEGRVTITFEWWDPSIAFDLVEAAVQSFLEARHASEIGVVGETISILRSHDARVQEEISQTVAVIEEKGRTSRTRGRPVVPPTTRPRVTQDDDLIRLQATLAARRRALADLEEMRQRRISELQAQLAQQLTTFAPQHPAVAATRQTMETLSAPSPQALALRTEIRDLESDLARRGGGSDQGAGALAAASADLALARYQVMDTLDPRLDVERSKLDLLLRRHANLLDRIEAARVEMDTAKAAFQQRYSVITPPEIPRQPKRHYGLLILFGGLVGGVGLAIFASAAVDVRSGLILEAWQVEKVLGLPVLGEVPR